METTSSRRRAIYTPSSKCSYGNDVALMAWGVQSLTSTQACAVPCGAAYHSLWKPHAFVRGASGGVYGVMAAHVSTMLMNWPRPVWKSNFGRPPPSTR